MTNWWWRWCQFFSYRSFLLTETDICLLLRRHIFISSRHDEDLSSHKCHLKCFTCSVPRILMSKMILMITTKMMQTSDAPESLFNPRLEGSLESHPINHLKINRKEKNYSYGWKHWLFDWLSAGIVFNFCLSVVFFLPSFSFLLKEKWEIRAFLTDECFFWGFLFLRNRWWLLRPPPLRPWNETFLG